MTKFRIPGCDFSGNKKINEKNLKAFQDLCKELNVKKLFMGRERKYGNVLYIDAITSGHLISLYFDQSSSDEIYKKLAEDFEIIEVDSSFFYIGGDESNNIEHTLFDIESSIKKEFLLECSKCGRSIYWGDYCPYCGEKSNIYLKLCDKCDMVYAPALSFCLKCGRKLSETTSDIREFNMTDDWLCGIEKKYIKLDEEEDKEEEKDKEGS